MKKRIHIKSVPHYIRKIVEINGLEKSANSLGITTNAVSKYLKRNEAPQVTEMASQLIFERNNISTKKSVIIKGDNDFISMIEMVAKNSHCTLTPIE